MTHSGTKEFLKKVDVCCGECGYDTEMEDPCAGCPVRKTVDGLDTDTRENVRLERGVFRNDYKLGDGTVAIKAGESIVIIDAHPENGETAEDVAGYCDVLNARGKVVLQTNWNEMDGLFVPR